MNITIGQPPATDRPPTNRSGRHRVEAVFGQPGSYPFLTHAMAEADAGAHDTIRVGG